MKLNVYIYLFFLVAIYSCSAESSKYQEVNTDYKSENLKKHPTTFFKKKWKKKAIEQLETSIDLLTLLRSNEVDSAVVNTILQELNNIVPTDSVVTKLNNFTIENDAKLKHFETSDSLFYLFFETNKIKHKVTYAVVEEKKYFGNTAEQVKTLKIIDFE